jgi:outer membrane protein assembly factor BamD (BamD/ComL family)
LQYRLKRYDQAITHFERFIELTPNAPEAAEVKSLLRMSARLLLDRPAGSIF